MEAPFSDDQLQTAIEALVDPERFRAAERRVAAAAPQLQRVLGAALAEGGWFEGAQVEHLAKVAAIEEPEQRLAELRTLLAEETRIGMMVGVAVGWELACELEHNP
jgi:hypothetical protein